MFRPLLSPTHFWKLWVSKYGRISTNLRLPLSVFKPQASHIVMLSKEHFTCCWKHGINNQLIKVVSRKPGPIVETDNGIALETSCLHDSMPYVVDGCSRVCEHTYSLSLSCFLNGPFACVLNTCGTQSLSCFFVCHHQRQEAYWCFMHLPQTETILKCYQSKHMALP